MRTPCRTLPGRWARWQSIQAITLHTNQLSGPLPDAWGNGTSFPAMTGLNLVWNALYLSEHAE